MSRGPTPARRWDPMRLAESVMRPEVRGAYRALEAEEPIEVWRNDRYTAHVRRHHDGWVIHLSIKRNDRKPVRDWRDLQRIKNDIAGPEVEAVELFPAMSRLVDTANQLHLWCLPAGRRFPLGFATRLILDHDDPLHVVGSVQRPLPDDWPVDRSALEDPLA